MKKMKQSKKDKNKELFQLLSEENKSLNLHLSQREKDIREHYLPTLQRLFNENTKLQMQVYQAVRSYHSLSQFGRAAEELGVDLKEVKLPEDNPYEGFTHETELLESGKVKTTMTVKRKIQRRKKNENS